MIGRPRGYPLMTLVDITNYLFSHFLTASTFSLEDDLGTIVMDRDEMGLLATPAGKRDLFQAALRDLEARGIVREIGGETGQGLYVLTQPLNTAMQPAILTPGTVEMLADLIEDVGEVFGVPPGYVPNRLAISDKDIQIVVQICHALLEDSLGDAPGAPGTGGDN